MEQTQVALYARSIKKSAVDFPKPFYNKEAPMEQPFAYSLFFKNPEYYQRQCQTIIVKML